MIVIGFNWPPHHDNSAAVIWDGKLVFASEEERFTRHKHSLHEPPINALKQALKFLTKRGVKPKDVDAYAINFDPRLYDFLATEVYETALKLSIIYNLVSVKELVFHVSDVIARNHVMLIKRLIRKAIRDLGEEVPPENEIKVYPVRHHLAHAASAYYLFFWVRFGHRSEHRRQWRIRGHYCVEGKGRRVRARALHVYVLWLARIPL